MTKKILSLLLVVMTLLMVSTPIQAKNNSVDVANLVGSTQSISIKGTTEAAAVLVQLRDASGNILEMKSFGTKDRVYSGTIECKAALNPGAKYSVYVADYEGGSWTIKDLTLQAKPVKSPKTGEQ